jgi:hypothetical protein
MAVERLVEQPLLADHLREQAHKLAVSTFSRAASAKAFSELFSHMIEA